MKVLAWFGPQDVRLIEMPIPGIIDEEDAVLNVTGSTMYESDLHLYYSEIMAMQKGDILGHEFMGIVDRIGKSVTKLSASDRVMASFQVV
ncbi:hypothetical protein FRB94_008655 [Tulasnella sp. JGI-2019a]|nr:hypothetical protein FRB93_012249 [Tulasnella sp. JGI-2019a]KAG9011371.1 hypothetical protein FRB94_008655 [Tulasnella sp. JGI-2019a]KAG9035494.1 hypothetical protein FRB95_011200 [Tulasnella sp. JGI-2019a]